MHTNTPQRESGSLFDDEGNGDLFAVKEKDELQIFTIPSLHTLVFKESYSQNTQRVLHEALAGMKIDNTKYPQANTINTDDHQTRYDDNNLILMDIKKKGEGISISLDKYTAHFTLKTRTKSRATREALLKLIEAMDIDGPTRYPEFNT